jgi:hypothetical protein
VVVSFFFVKCLRESFVQFAPFKNKNFKEKRKWLKEEVSEEVVEVVVVDVAVVLVVDVKVNPRNGFQSPSLVVW